MNVLMVDDEYLELEQLTQLIYKRYPNWNVFSAEDGTEATSIASTHLIHLALLDIHLSGESGLDLADKLQSLSKGIKFVIITAYQDFEYAKRAIKLNAIDYIVKPIIQKELYEVLDSLGKKSRSPSVTPLLEKGMKFVQNNYAKNIHLQDVAEHIHVSANYLSKKFNDELHASFNDYLAQLRINQAKSLMIEHPEYSLQYISDAVGYSSQNYFTNSFKKYEQMTPTQFKREKIGF
ncbi:response regulator [Sporolactobacillus sp. STCC-11]|uniref:response regulator transcription factor n=1 Tax=Sporolactobacillus caesalpiniae TaxID=3230362 RepID=UPI003396F20E